MKDYIVYMFHNYCRHSVLLILQFMEVQCAECDWILQGFHKDTVEFYFDSRDICKNFWKVCLEHHAFFRCQTVKRLPRRRGALVSRGSSFRQEPSHTSLSVFVCCGPHIVVCLVSVTCCLQSVKTV